MILYIAYAAYFLFGLPSAFILCEEFGRWPRPWLTVAFFAVLLFWPAFWLAFVLILLKAINENSKHRSR